MTAHNLPEIEFVVRRIIENGCAVDTVIADPADQQAVLYGTVTRDGLLIGSYYCTERTYQRDWRIVTADGHPLTLDDEEVRPVSHPAAVWVLTRILTAPPDEIHGLLHDSLRAPS